MIRQAISCNICGLEKRQTNHWFLAYEQAGELRVSGWSSRNLMSPGTKHLCGETCLHKLLSQFLAKSVFLGTECTKDKPEALPRTASTIEDRITAPAHAQGKAAGQPLTAATPILPESESDIVPMPVSFGPADSAPAWSHAPLPVARFARRPARQSELRRVLPARRVPIHVRTRAKRFLLP